MGFSGTPRSHEAAAEAAKDADTAVAVAAIAAEAAVAADVVAMAADENAKADAVEAALEAAEDAEITASLAIAAEAAALAVTAGPTQIDLEFPTVWEAVKFKLGEDFLRPFPEDKKALLQDDKFLVTVDLEPGLTPEGYTPATEQDIADKGDRDMAKLLGEAAKMALHGGMLDKIPWIGMGVALGLVGAMALGWIPVGGGVV